MAIPSINSQAGLQNPLSPNARVDERRLEAAAAARAQTVDAGTLSSAIDKRAAALGTQKSDRAGEDRQDAQNSQPDDKTLNDAVEQVKRFVQSVASEVNFSVDEESGIRVVKVIDKETNEVIRQMPSKEIVELAKALDKLQGLMIRQTA